MAKFVEKIILNISENTSELVGELTRQTVMQISPKSIDLLLANKLAVIDLKQVTRADTAGLAWIFYLIEKANEASCELSFSNVPAKLTKLISLSGVDGFLPINT